MPLINKLSDSLSYPTTPIFFTIENILNSDRIKLSTLIPYLLRFTSLRKEGFIHENFKYLITASAFSFSSHRS